MIIDNKSLETALKNLQDTGMVGVPETIRIAIPDARENLENALNKVIGEQPLQWLPEYDEIVDWLADNEGRGLFCYGNVGRGKTLICAKAIPVLLNCIYHKVVEVVDAVTMNNQFRNAGKNEPKIKTAYLKCVDDVGTESVLVEYGNKHEVFNEVVDEAERKGYLLLVTTNLTLDEFVKRYGERTLDRLRHITKCVKFKGDSLRN